MKMRKAALVILIMIIALPSGSAFSQQSQSLVPKNSKAGVVDKDQIVSAEIAEITSNPGQFDGYRVTLEGKVKKVKYTKSGKGEDFTVFELKDGEGNKIGVYYEDEHLPIEKGDTVRIMGRFKEERKYFLYKIKNSVKARTVETVEAESAESPNL